MAKNTKIVEGISDEEVKRYKELIKNEFGLTDKQISPLWNALRFKSNSTKQTYLTVFRKWLEAGGVFDEETAIKVIEQYSPNSRPVAFYALRFIYRAYGEELKLGDVIPKTIRRHKEIMDFDEVVQLIDYVKHNEPVRTKVYFILSTIYGLRRVEIFRFRPEDVDLDRKVFTVITAKGGEVREHLIPDNLYEYFELFMKFKEKFNPFIRADQLNSLFDVVCHRAGIKLRPRLGWHSIRRLLVTELMKLDINPLLVRNFLRWKPRNQDIMMEYIIFDPIEVDRRIFEVHPFLSYW